MAQRLGFFDQWAFGEWADRNAINRNADDLSMVEASVEGMQAQIARQQKELLQLRAMLMGVVEVLHAKAPFDDAELDAAVAAAHAQLTAPRPPVPHPGRTPPAPRSTQTTACAKCQRAVALSATNITALGNVCDACV